MRYSGVSVQGLLSRLGTGFPPVLRRIGQYVQDNTQLVIYQTITDVAEKADASEASVVRFCRALGFASFSDFKMALALDDQQEVSLPQTPGEESKIPLGEISLKLEGRTNRAASSAEALIQTIRDVAKNVDDEELDTVVDLLHKAPFVIIAGVGGSSHLAQYGEYRLLRAGKNARFDRDPHVELVHLSTVPRESLLLFFSVSGASHYALRLARAAWGKGMKSVLLTSSERSLLSKKVTHVLSTSVLEQSMFATNFFSHMSELFLFEVVFDRLVTRYPQYKESLTESASIIKEILY